MHVMENVAFIFQLVAVLYSIVNNTGSVVAKECSPSGDMCDIDQINCLLNLRKRFEISECYGIVVEPKLPSINRGPIGFWISIDDEELDIYPTNLTYSVYRIDNSNDAGIPSYLKKVDGCCNMGLHDKCTLPKTEPNEKHAVYVTTATDPSENTRYCESVIHEEEICRYCQDEKDKICFEYEDEVLYFKDTFESSSTAKIEEQIDFCFFPIQDFPIHDFPEIPDDYEKGKPFWMQKDEFSVGLDDCSMVEHDKGPKEKLSGKIKLYTDIKHEGIVCFYVKIDPGEWKDNVGCAHMSTDSPSQPISDWPSPIGVSMLVLGSLLLISIAAACCHKKGILHYTYKRGVQDMQIRVVAETVDNNNKESARDVAPLAWKESSREVFYPFLVSVACNTVQENKIKSGDRDCSAVSVEKNSENMVVEMDKMLSDQRIFEKDTRLDRTVTLIER